MIKSVSTMSIHRLSVLLKDGVGDAGKEKPDQCV